MRRREPAAALDLLATIARRLRETGVLLASGCAQAALPVVVAPTMAPTMATVEATPVTAVAAPPTPIASAISEYLRAIEIDRARPEAWFGLAVLLLDRCPESDVNFRRGREYLRRAILRGEFDPRYVDLVARARAHASRSACPRSWWASGFTCHPRQLFAVDPSAPSPPAPTPDECDVPGMP